MLTGVTGKIDMGAVYWVTGLSGAGKTTVAVALAARLRNAGRSVILLDGDILRSMLGPLGEGHAPDQRKRLAFFYARLCRGLAVQGHDVVCATISMFHDVQRWNRAETPEYREIYLRATVEALTARDTKGIYAAADGRIVGIDLEFEAPETPDLTFSTDGATTAEMIVDAILAHWAPTAP